MSKVLIRFDVLALLFSITLFLLMPGLDLRISALFFHPDSGFYLGNTFFPQAVRFGIRYLAIGVILLVTALVVISFAAKGSSVHPHRYRILFIFLAMMFGPTLIINGVVKENSGRARPAQISNFGGIQEYSPPLTISNQCETNCSFVSGHAGAGFFFLTFAFLSPLYRRYWIVFGCAFGLIAGFGRIMSGSHFLSDIIFAGFICWFSIMLVHYLMLKARLLSE